MSFRGANRHDSGINLPIFTQERKWMNIPKRWSIFLQSCLPLFTLFNIVHGNICHQTMDSSWQDLPNPNPPDCICCYFFLETQTQTSIHLLSTCTYILLLSFLPFHHICKICRGLEQESQRGQVGLERRETLFLIADHIFISGRANPGLIIFI